MHGPTHVQQSRFKEICIFRGIKYRNDLEKLSLKNIEKKRVMFTFPPLPTLESQHGMIMLYCTYRKIRKISPGAYIFHIRRGLSSEGNLRLKIDWSCLIVGSKFTVFALFYFAFDGNYPSTSPRGTYIWRAGRLNGGSFALPVWGAYTLGGGGGLYLKGLIHGGAYFWNFTIFEKTPTFRRTCRPSRPCIFIEL